MATLESERLAEASLPDASEAKPQSRLQFMLRALKYRNYRLFFIGQLFSLMGTWMTQVAISWLVYELTRSPLILGSVNFVGQVPAFLLGPIAGVVLDRLDKRRLLIVTQALGMLQSFSLALLAFTGHANVWSLGALMCLQGIINAFDMPARQSFVIELVDDKADLSNAIALNSSMFNMARLVGPAIGGLIYWFTGAGWCFLLDGFSYLSVIIAFVLMRTVPHIKPAIKRNPLHELREGVTYAYNFPPIRSILILLVSMSLMGMPYIVLLPVMAKTSLGGDSKTFGFMMAASGLGAITAALSLAARKSVLGLGRVIPYSTLLFGAATLAYSQVTHLAFALPLLFVMGFAMMRQNAACNTIVQTVVDSDKRGRVMSLYTMSLMGMAPFGSLWAGAVASKIGAPSTLIICAAGSVLAGCFFLWNLPVIREAMRPIYRELGLLPDKPQHA